MNHIRSHTKVYSLAIALVVFTSIVLAAAIDARASLLSRQAELASIKDDAFPANTRLTGPSRLEELARIKDDMLPANARLTGPSRLEELAQIKDNVFPVDDSLTRASSQASLAANPELALARREAALKILADSAYLAANPELSLARRTMSTQSQK